MVELSDLIKDVASELKVTDIDYAEEVVELEGLDFDSTVTSVIENEQSRTHMGVVYASLNNAEPEFIREVVALQLQYEVAHSLRRQLHKKFADSYLGDREEVELPHPHLNNSTRKYTRRHFETWTHPIANRTGDSTDNTGYRYIGSPVEHITEELPPEARSEHKDLLNTIGLMYSLETAYVNTIYGPVNSGERDLQKLKTDHVNNIALHCVQYLRPVA